MLVKNGKNICETLNEIERFIGIKYPTLLVSYGDMDMWFLHQAYRKCKLNMPKNWDYLDMFRVSQYYRSNKKHSQAAFATEYDIKNNDAHRALSDAKTLFLLFKSFKTKQQISTNQIMKDIYGSSRY